MSSLIFDGIGYDFMRLNSHIYHTLILKVISGIVTFFVLSGVCLQTILAEDLSVLPSLYLFINILYTFIINISVILSKECHSYFSENYECSSVQITIL